MSLLDDASIVITPNGVKAGTLFAVIPSDGTADMDFTRATTATRIDENGDIVSVATGVPRIDFTGGGCPHILAEPQRTNIVFPSDVAVTQTRTVTAVEQVLTFYGTGTVVLTGTHSATLTGTGVNDRVELIFTPTAGSLTLTVTGTVTNWQLEVGSYPTSVIDTVSGSVTRNQEIFTRDGIGSLINSVEGVFFVEISTNTDSTDKAISISDAAGTNRIWIGYSTAAKKIYSLGYVGGALQFAMNTTVADESVFAKVAVKYKQNDFALWVDGVEVATDSSGNTYAADTLNKLSFNIGQGGGAPFYGKVKQLQVYDTALTDTQLQELTSYVPSFLLEDNGFLLQEDGNKIII
jgi:hypothetical protein